jgi:hypothetical protein
MFKKITVPEMLVLLVALGILLIALLTFDVKAQELASDGRMNGLDQSSGKFSIGASFSNNNTTVNKADLSSQEGVPGKGIEMAPDLQKPFYSITSENPGIKKFLNRFQELMEVYFAGKTQIKTTSR